MCLFLVGVGSYPPQKCEFCDDDDECKTEIMKAVTGTGADTGAFEACVDAVTCGTDKVCGVTFKSAQADCSGLATLACSSGRVKRCMTGPTIAGISTRTCQVRQSSSVCLPLIVQQLYPSVFLPL